MTRPLRVLLVDDDATDRVLAEEAFAMLKHPCILITAASGSDALRELSTPHAVLPDLILLDINMPGMNGFTVLSQIKQDPRLCALPVMMLTTSNADDDVAQAYALHASAYIPKSVGFEGFLEQIQSLMSFWTKAKMTTWPTPLG